MNQTIRKRIEDINNGIVPEGYKQTPFGIFPCDWETKKLSYGVDIIDGDRGKEYPKETDFSDTGYCLFLNAGNVTANGFCFKNNQFIAEEKCNKLKKGKLALNDIVITTRGTVGNFAMFSQQIPYRHMRINSGMAIIKTKGRFDLGYLFCSLKSYMIKNQIKKICFGSAQPQLTIPSISRMQIAFPKDKAEQGKIADILMKWDEAVELQEQYIQKLELRKKSIMKKLLTPKDGWRKCKLKDFIKVKSGYAFKSETYVEEGKYQILTIKNVQKGVLDLNEVSTINELPSNIQKHQILALDDIIISLTGNVGRSCYITKENCLLNQRVGRIECSNEYKQFVYAILQADDFINAMINIAQGGAQANLSNEDVENFEFYMPYIDVVCNKELVYEIGQINFMIDEEISLQKEKLVKIKEQRKAMQQYLLTGIVRVG